MNDNSAETVGRSGAQPTHRRYVVLAGLCLAATISYVQRNCIAVAEENIRGDLGLSLREMGWVMSGFFLSYALFQIPSGLLGDRWGTRRMLSLYCGAWSLATGLTGLATGFYSLWPLRFTGGVAQAGIFPCAANTLRKWFAPSQRGLGSGALASFMSVGTVIASALGAAVLVRFGWRWMFLLFSLPGFLWAVWFYLWFRDRPQQHPEVNQDELALITAGAEPDNLQQALGPRPATPWLAIFSSAPLWCICGQQFFRAAGYMFYTSWFPTFLKESRGVSIVEAGWLTSLPVLAVVVAAPLGGMFSDRLLAATGSRRIGRQAVAVVSMLACAVFILLAYPIADPLGAVLVITAGSFCAAAGGPCAYSITMDMGGRNVATVFSTMNMAGNAGAWAFPIAMAWFIEETGNWDAALLVFAGIYVATAVFWMLLNPEGTIGEKARETSQVQV